MESLEMKSERENWDVFADVAKKSETERRRSRKRKRMRMPNPKTLVLGSDSESDSMTYSEYEDDAFILNLDHRYCTRVRKTDGFDIDMDNIPLEDEQIIPFDLDIYSDVAIKFGKFAVDDYNKKQPEGGIKLAFVKPLKCNIQLYGGLTYYITFEAKDVDAPDDQSRTYQTEVFDLFKTPPQVKIFRPKLTEITTELPAEIQSHGRVPDFIPYTLETIQSKGYDIDHYPVDIHECLIKPMKLDAENTQLATKLGECALESYYRQKKRKQRRYQSEEKKEKGPVVQLEFFQPLQMYSQKIKYHPYIRYYLTFHAKVVGVPDDHSPIAYQTEVTVSDGVVTVHRFRPKPTLSRMIRISSPRRSS